jgi:hypothetical protein
MRVDNNSVTVVNKKASVEAEEPTEIQFLIDVLNHGLSMSGISGANADKLHIAKNALAAILAG